MGLLKLRSPQWVSSNRHMNHCGRAVERDGRAVLRFGGIGRVSALGRGGMGAEKTSSYHLEPSWRPFSRGPPAMARPTPRTKPRCRISPTRRPTRRRASRLTTIKAALQPVLRKHVGGPPGLALIASWFAHVQSTRPALERKLREAFEVTCGAWRASYKARRYREHPTVCHHELRRLARAVHWRRVTRTFWWIG